jgi:hypothetical protein
MGYIIMSTLITENIKHPDSNTNNIVLNPDGTVSIGSVSSNGTTGSTGSNIVSTAFTVLDTESSIISTLNPDNVFPSTSGTQIMSINYNKTLDSGILRIRSNISYTPTTQGVRAYFALFANTTLLRVIVENCHGGSAANISFEEFYEFDNDLPVEISIRAASNTNNTLVINSHTSSVAKFGGARKSLLIIDEVAQ